MFFSVMVGRVRLGVLGHRMHFSQEACRSPLSLRVYCVYDVCFYQAAVGCV